MQTLSELFIASKGAPIEVNGAQVVSMYTKIVETGQAIDVHFEEVAASPPQGLRIKVKGGSILINAQELAEVVLWKETAPPQFAFQCIKRGKAKEIELRVWNCWLDEKGVSQAWIGNAGMIVQEEPGRVTLRCSPGRGPFDPNSMVVSLHFSSTNGHA
ncbi:hypothetical protein [Ralstonia solanacearum]|uniref:hypothetical protein n=1 Tax=Ralstonia solanacearum TaxID=305 RepID=UPI0012FE1629|nr:hypothetical protein [Ralstonia solanacearum]